MQVAGMHGIAEVVINETIAALPPSHAQDAAPGRVGKLGGQIEVRSVRLLLAGEIDEDAVVRLDDAIAIDGFAALERAARHGRNPNDGAAAVECHTVIAAGDVVLVDFAAREARAAMRAVILQALNAAGGIAPEHEMTSERSHAMRLAAPDLHRFCDGVPLAENARDQPLLDRIPVDAHVSTFDAVAVLTCRHVT